MNERNERFKKALDWLYTNGKVTDQRELSSITDINEATISRILNNKVRQPSPETIRKLVSKFPELNPAYIRAESDSITIDGEYSHGDKQQPIDPSSMTNAIIASLHVTISAKDETIAGLNSQLEYKNHILERMEKDIDAKSHTIEHLQSRIRELESYISKCQRNDISDYPFPIGVADDHSDQPPVNL